MLIHLGLCCQPSLGLWSHNSVTTGLCLSSRGTPFTVWRSISLPLASSYPAFPSHLLPTNCQVVYRVRLLETKAKMQAASATWPSCTSLEAMIMSPFFIYLWSWFRSAQYFRNCCNHLLSSSVCFSLSLSFKAFHTQLPNNSSQRAGLVL